MVVVRSVCIMCSWQMVYEFTWTPVSQTQCTIMNECKILEGNADDISLNPLFLLQVSSMDFMAMKRSQLYSMANNPYSSPQQPGGGPYPPTQPYTSPPPQRYPMSMQGRGQMGMGGMQYPQQQVCQQTQTLNLCTCVWVCVSHCGSWMSQPPLSSAVPGIVDNIVGDIVMGHLLLEHSAIFPLSTWHVQFAMQSKIPGRTPHTLACGGVTPVHHSVPLRLPPEWDGLDAMYVVCAVCVWACSFICACLRTCMLDYVFLLYML